MLILNNEEIESFLSINTCIAALENVYRSWDNGTAINRPRTDLVMPLVTEAGVYAFKSMEAGLYDPPIVAAHDAIDIIKKGPAHAHEVNVEHPFRLSAPALKDLVTGKARGRANAQESTCFLNNIGIGLQFAAVGAAVFSEAKAKGIAREIPTDWFLESVHP